MEHLRSDLDIITVWPMAFQQPLKELVTQFVTFTFTARLVFVFFLAHFFPRSFISLLSSFPPFQPLKAKNNQKSNTEGRKGNIVVIVLNETVWLLWNSLWSCYRMVWNLNLLATRVKSKSQVQCIYCCLKNWN